MRKLIKILSIILVVVFCVQIIAPGATAITATPFVGNNVAKSASKGITLPSQNDDLGKIEADSIVQNIDSSDNEIVTPIMGEITELRTENAKHYRHEDGTYTAAVYPEPIHYMDSSGSWKDIDNTLTLKSVAGKATYTPTAAALDIRIPQDFSNNQMLTIGKDGYTVGMRIKSSDNLETMSRASATASTTITSAKAVINNNFESLQAVNTSTNIDASASNNLKVEAENKQLMKLEKKVSAVNYNGILDGANLQYVITPSRVKENIIVTKTQDSYVYQFELALDGLTPVDQENGSINLYENIDDEEPLFTIEAPYMYDATEETSFNVTMSLNGNILTVTADAEWVNDANRKFPVVIDPTFSANTTTFYDATANQNTPDMNFPSFTTVYAGNGTLNLRRTYIKFTLPQLPEGSVVTESKLTLIQHDVTLGNSERKLMAFDLTQKDSWSEGSITWNNQPVINSSNAAIDDNEVKTLDYASFQTTNVDGRSYSFNITKAVKNWYEGCANNGVMITSDDESANSQAILYSSEHEDTTLHPSVTIRYNNNIGLEDYWSYETVDIGRAGSIYANPYNGSVTYVHSDLNMTGNLLPINISHVFNNNTSDVYSSVYSGMLVGKKFHLSIQEVLVQDHPRRYKHYDADGTLHYYIYKQNGFVHEYDPTKTLTVSDSEYILSDSQGNKKHFNSAGQLYKLVDNNGNTQTFTFSGNLITKVTDPVGRAAVLEYNSNGQLISITDPAGRVTTYTYSGTTTVAKLSKTTYSNGDTTSLQYATDNLACIRSNNRPNCIITYNNLTYRGYRVSTIRQYDKTPQVVNLSTFRYVEDNESGIASGNTVVSRYFDIDKTNFDGSHTYLFDTYGRVTSITNEDHQTRYAVYGTPANYAYFNKIQDSSELLTIATNTINNHGFENGNDGWSALQTASGSWGVAEDSTSSSLGRKYMQLELTGNSGTFEVGQDFTAIAGEIYTVSVDINIPNALELNNNNGVAFGLVYCIDGTWYNSSSRWLGSTSGWERFSHTVTLPSGNITNCHVFLELVNAEGIVRFDNVQVEKSGGARSYNLVENSDFSTGTGSDVYGWTSSDMQTGDGVKFDVGAGRNCYMMMGSVSKAKSICQKVYVNAKAGDSLIIGGKIAAYVTNGISNFRKFEMRADLYNAEGTRIKYVTIPFDKKISQERQVKAAYVPVEEDCEYINLYFNYHYQADAFTIDNAFVYVDNYGEHYSYDATNGLTTAVYNDEGTKTEYVHGDDTDVDEVTQTVSGVEQTVATYTYDDNHNILTATNNIGTKIEYKYNSTGQVTKQTTISVDENGRETRSSETFLYGQNGNYLYEHVDANGIRTRFAYDNTTAANQIKKGLLTSVTDAYDCVTTYTYDPDTDELLSVSGSADSTVPELTSTTTFSYEDYLPKTISRNGTTYSYEYDSQNRVVSSKVGNQVLSTNLYDNRQRLSGVEYGNDDIYTPLYDNRDRLVGDSWNNTQISQYYYNDNDRLSKVVDNITNTSYQYDYAFYDLPLRITGSDGTLTTYDYDKSGTLSRLTFSDDNANIYSGKYYSNEKGMPEDIVIDTLDNTLIHYNYDDLGRVESYSYGPVIRTITYRDTVGNTRTTARNQIKKIVDETQDGEILQSYSFKYESTGYLYEITETVDNQTVNYYYDELGRLVDCSESADNFHTFTYDVDGNITSIGFGYDPIHTFTYSNANWKDQLTAFDGKPITYDDIGNPLTYDGYTYTWDRGTKLAGITGNGKNISYVYDSQGNRVQKTVNGVTTNYLYSGNLLMSQTDGTNTIDFQYDVSGDVVGFIYNGTPYYYMRTLLNDISGIVDREGNVVAKYRYDAFGNIIYSTGDLATINPIRYRGYYYDTETNWYYLQLRYYNPEWCRFISPDCLFIAGDAVNGSNMYAYCNNNPVKYIDTSGAASETNKIDLKPVANGIRIISGSISKLISEATSGLFSLITDPILTKLTNCFNKRFGANATPEENRTFANSYFMTFIGTPILCIGSLTVLPLLDLIIDPGQKFPESPEFELPTGIRHFTPWSMEFLSGYATYFLGFESDGGEKTYITNPNKFMWQSMVGYNWFYDYFFSLGGPIEKIVLPFEAPATNLFPDASYAVWCWKADYWNLGAGAEIGIYWQPIKALAERGFYRIDQENLLVDVNMQVTYDHSEDELSPDNHTEVLHGNGEQHLSLKQTSWWITNFTPKIQFVDLDALNVCQAVNFAESGIHSNLYEAFYEKYSNDDTHPELSWSVSEPQWEYLNFDSEYPYEFYLQY